MENKTKKILTLCIVHNHSKVLLGIKKRGFGSGKWNGFGGKIEKGESIKEAALRELKEETGLVGKDINNLGVLDFEFLGNPEILEVHVFKAADLKGEPKETEEMAPKWFNINEVPFDLMWPDDKYWFPLFLSDKKFRGKFLFEGQDKIIEMDLKEVKEI
ncbi:MAG: 8-oxo-dGTP diphosphatase [Candidatus Nealsonbacteria bacterium]|nr:8-oxo-dGTP diphosphatase [Candidatus Nealsonbacteria bacterium]